MTTEQGSAEPCSVKLQNSKGIIFDFDGTLYDTALLPLRLIAAYPPDMFRIRNERIVRKEFAACDYASSEEYYRAFFASLGKACRLSPEQMRSWYFERYMPRMIRVLKKHYKPRPGVKELFLLFCPTRAAGKTLKKIAVYSDYPLLKERLKALDINTGVIRLYGPESFGAQKPAPRPFLQIAGDLGLAPAETLVVGDREDTDGLGALGAGMRFYCCSKADEWNNLIKLLLEKT